ncbi:PASTA domain-containing protein [Amycolatopsis sp. NPDC049252]|uniref:PASTA domain-containing protein n=1 Tax=Amycolatopsis sp. NPDC049252 TaxID=3363933 RepID=UPI00371DC80E
MSRTPVLLVAFALVAAGCGAPPGEPGRATTTAASAAPTSAALIKVPDVSGMNHQDAQNAMQKAGLYNLREVDGTGQGRALLIDRNWVQTGQDPAPGTEVQPDAVITLTAVKITER